MTTVTEVLERLQICAAEITGIKRTFKYPPSLPIENPDLPAVYPLIGGGEQGSRPETQSGTQVHARTYGLRVLVRPVSANQDSGNDGQKVYETVIPYIERFWTYFLNHARLHTDAGLPELDLVRDITISDSGLVSRSAPGGTLFWALDFQFTIATREVLAGLLF